MNRRPPTVRQCSNDEEGPEHILLPNNQLQLATFDIP